MAVVELKIHVCIGSTGSGSTQLFKYPALDVQDYRVLVHRDEIQTNRYHFRVAQLFKIIK